MKILILFLLLIGTVRAQTPTPSPTPNSVFCRLNLPSAAYQAWKAANCR